MGDTEVGPDPDPDPGSGPSPGPGLQPDPGKQPDERPPLGSWAKTYIVTVVFAVACIALLYWFTAAFNIPWYPKR